MITRELRFKKPAERKLRFEKPAERELRLQKEEADAETPGPKIDTSLYKDAHDKKPRGRKGWGFSLDGSRNVSVWFLGDYDDACDYARNRFRGAKKIFVLP